MTNLKRLQSRFRDLPFSPKDIKNLGIAPNELNEFLENESVFRLSRGIYVLAGTDLSDESLFRATSMRIDGPSAVCLVSALAFYGVTDQIPKKIWLLVPENKHTAHKDIRLFRSRNPKWKIGIDSHEDYRITTLERSIVDSLIAKRILGPSLGIRALKNAIQGKKTSLDKILKMATQLGVDHRIMSYIEALS